VIEAAMAKFSEPGEELLAWLGPAIGPKEFEVGGEVRERFLAENPNDEDAFVAYGADKWLADIYSLARTRLKSVNCGYIGGGDYCTVSESERFFSYRRDGITGRMAALIWIEDGGIYD
jgi:copper oxidase (laccase) domain-containing protein